MRCESGEGRGHRWAQDRRHYVGLVVARDLDRKSGDEADACNFPFICVHLRAKHHIYYTYMHICIPIQVCSSLAKTLAKSMH